jgi:N-methylhydantoinase A/oxoprolinase/acetone carboxylase beta subunit
MHGPKPPSAATKGHRDGYWRGRTVDFALFEMDEMQAGNVVNGPAVIEHPATTLLVPPDHHIELDDRRLIHYRRGTRD